MAKMTAKKALLTSILSLLVCITMLVGTTFAWFTDSVTSGTNKIIAGNLDVEFYHTNAAIANDPVEGETKLFKDVTLWEPGAYAYEKFTVANEGTLALKYALTIHHIFHNTVYYSGQNTGYSLLDALYVKEVEEIPSARPDYAKADGTPIADYVNAAAISGVLAAGAKRDRIVVIYWPQDANDNNLNLQNGKYASDSAYAGDNTLDYATNKGALTIDFAVSLVATQNTVESDSFDDQYDKDAEYPVISIASTTITGPLDLTKVSVLEIKTPEQNTAIKYAEVPAQAANAVYEAIVAEAEATTAESNELTLSLNVEKTSETTTEQGTTVDLQIDMNAVLKTTKNSVTTTTEKAVTALQDYVTINYSLGEGLTDVAATHNGNGMEALISADAVPTNANGGYYYNSTTGILTIKTKSFSPFEVSYVVPVTGIALDQHEADLIAGQSVTLSATVAPANATNKTVTWTTSDPAVATVTDGVVKTLAGGTVTVTATAGGFSDTCAITVTESNYTVILANEDVKGTYETLAAAITATENGSVLKVNTDEAFSAGSPFVVDKTITIDLNGHKLSFDNSYNPAIRVTGDLTVKNSGGNKANCAIERHLLAGETNYAIKVENGGAFTLLSGAVTGPTALCVAYGATAEIKGGALYGLYDGILNQGTVTVNAEGEADEGYYVTVSAKVHFQLYNGDVIGQMRNGVTNGGNLTLNEGYIYGERKGVYNNANWLDANAPEGFMHLTMNGGVIEGQYSIYADQATVTIGENVDPLPDDIYYYPAN